MKKRFSLTKWDISLIEITDILITLWAIGLLLAYFPLITQNFLIKWRWALFAIAIIIGIKPLWRILYGPHSDEAQPDIKTKKPTKQKPVTKNKKTKRKK